MMLPREALAFDVYGTLVDPIRIWQQLEQYLPDRALLVAQIWRQKQLEFTFRLTVMEQYQDFEQVTRMALDYALDATGLRLADEQKQVLMEQYNHLERFADVTPGLQSLQEAGSTMVAFSNGSPAMLNPLIDAAQLRPYLQRVISVDEVRMYKPSPKVYQHVAAVLDRPIDQIRLISSNPFDVIGALAAGMQATWIDRSGGLFDPLGPRPQMVVKTLTELADLILDT